jgi:hypothetical protein
VSFAFANPAGDRLLVWDEVPAPATLVKAVCAGGAVVDVRWVGHQKAGEASNGREDARNFANVMGELFEPTPALAKVSGSDDEQDCLLAGAVFAQARSFVAVTGSGDCAPGVRERLARVRGRALTACARKGTLGADHQVVLAVFEPRGKSLLASMAVLGPGRIAWHDYAAEMNEQRLSCWRVDDDCTFPPGWVDVVFGYTGPGGTMGLMLAWGGLESQSLTLVEGQSGALRELASSSRYWTPE